LQVVQALQSKQSVEIFITQFGMNGILGHFVNFVEKEITQII
jgi:hypothetical protein